MTLTNLDDAFRPSRTKPIQVRLTNSNLHVSKQNDYEICKTEKEFNGEEGISRHVHPVSSKGKSLRNVGSSLDSSVMDNLHLGMGDILREVIMITIIIKPEPSPPSSPHAS